MSNDFIFVKHKKKGRRNPQVALCNIGTISQDLSFDRESCIRRIQEAKEDILSSDFYESIKASLREGLQLLNGPRISGIICFGLGKFTQCMISRYQFALLLLFRDLYSGEITAYDPVFGLNEHDILEHYGVNLMKENTEGKYSCQLGFNDREVRNGKCGCLLEHFKDSKNLPESVIADASNQIEHSKNDCELLSHVLNKTCDKIDLTSENSNDSEFLINNKHDFESSDESNGKQFETFNNRISDNNDTTIFFLPHCSKQLSNNLLWANWGLNLSKCIIIANSFNKILETNTPRVISNNAEYLLKISPYVKELAVINLFRFYEIFNDTAIHIFPKQTLSLVSEDFWDDNKEPVYNVKDIEIIRKPCEVLI